MAETPENGSNEAPPFSSGAEYAGLGHEPVGAEIEYDWQVSGTRGGRKDAASAFILFL